MATNNLFPPSDEDPKISSSTGGMDKFFVQLEKNLQKDLKLIKDFRKETEIIKKNMLDAMGVKQQAGSGNIGLGTMPRIAAVSAMVAGGAVKTFMGMAPDTMSAVTQRMSADTVAGISGLNSRQVILRANKAIGGGATSAMGATMAQMNMLYGGGYTANSVSSRNVMGQVGGLSALTGGTNEQMAAGIAGINAMRFLRIGVQARDAKGNLKPPNQLINETYRFLYGGRKITPEQAAMVLNPGSKGYQTISMIAGGDQNLMSILQMGVIARAKKDSPLTKKDLKGANNALDILGVGKESPIRRNYAYNTSEARKLQATEKGLVGGYNSALDVTTAVNNGFSNLAEATDGLTQAFMGLKGFMQTLPGAGNTGSTLAGLGGNALGMGSALLQYHMLSKMMGGKGLSAVAGRLGMSAATTGAMGVAGGAAGASLMGRAKNFIKGGKFLKAAGRAGLAMGVYQGLDWLQGKMQMGPGWLRGIGNFAFDTGQGALTGLVAGGLPGAVAGTAVGAAGSLMSPYGSGGGDCAHGNIGAHNCSSGMGGGDAGLAKSVPLQSPVPKGTKITSGFGPRDNSKNPQISSNHTGVDYGVPVGTPIMAAGYGVVTETGLHRQYGNYVIIKHGSKSTLYGHLSKILVNRGDTVMAGQTIALSGGKRGAQGAGTSTGPHLHFEVRANGGVGAQGRVNPVKLFGKPIGGKLGAVLGFFKNKFTSGLNFIKKTSNRLFGTNFAYSDNSGSAFNFNSRRGDITGRSLEDYSSSSVSSIIAGLNFSPTSHSELSKYINTRDKKFGSMINTSHDIGYMGEQGIYGGSRQALMRALYDQGFRGKALKTAFAVALAESGGRPSAIGDEHLTNKKWGPSYGIFQIRSLKNWQNHDGKGSSDPLRDASKLRDPQFNINAAWVKSKHGRNWKGWAAYTNGAFTKFLDDADRVAEKAGIGGADPGVGLNMGQTPLRTETGSTGVITGGMRHTTANINVQMHVVLQNSSDAEAQKLLRTFKSKLESELEIKGIGGN